MDRYRATIYTSNPMLERYTNTIAIYIKQLDQGISIYAGVCDAGYEQCIETHKVNAQSINCLLMDYLTSRYSAYDAAHELKKTIDEVRS
jgi:hypothetical protein